jgi:AraC-like DNA-binding protein
VPADRIGRIRTRTALRWLAPGNGIGVGFIVDRDCSAAQRRALAEMERGRLRAPLVGYNYVLAGAGSYRGHDDVERPLRLGVFFHFDHSRRYRLVHRSADFAECYCAIHRDHHDHLARLGIVPEGCAWRDLGLQPGIVEAYEQLRREVDDPRSHPAQLLGRLMGLLELVSTARGPGDDRDDLVLRARRLLGADLAAPLGVAEVARRLGISYSYLHRVFTAATGCSPKEFRIRARIETAGRMLHGKPAKRVAAELGYDNQFFFSRQFKRYAGCSPRDWVARGRSWHPLLGG